MKGQNNFRALKNLIFAITIFAGFINAAGGTEDAKDIAGANGISEQTISVIARNLTEKLRADLADNSVMVKVNDIKKYQALKNGIEVEGNGTCLVTSDNKLPIRFEVKLDARAKAIADIKYDFVQYETSEFAPTSTEEVLMNELMKKVSADYKTDEVVIAIDGFETAETADGRKAYVGNGEIRIGEVEWRKIKFDVTLEADNRASKIKYDVQK